MIRKIGGWYRIGIMFIQEKIARQGEAVIVLKRGKQIADPQIHEKLLYIDGTYLYYKHILAGGIILVFLGIGIITLNSRRLVTNFPKDKVP